jgi:general secretion pathway protein I
MITLAILGMSLTAISRSQQNSVRAANRAKWITVATMLARYKMVDVEDKLFEEGFSDFDEDDKGDFKDEGFERFTYEVKIDKVELPASVNSESIGSALGIGGDDDSDSGSPQSRGSGMLQMGTQMLAKQFEMIRNVLEESIRRVQLKVEWKEGSRTRAVTVVGYFTDPRKIDAAASGRITPAVGGGVSGPGPFRGAGGAAGQPQPGPGGGPGGGGAIR